MKRIASAFALFVASLFITAGVSAQSVKVNVPFSFTIGNRTMPAGSYTISSTSSDVAHLLRPEDVNLMTTALWAS